MRNERCKHRVETDGQTGGADCRPITFLANAVGNLKKTALDRGRTDRISLTHDLDL